MESRGRGGAFRIILGRTFALVWLGLLLPLVAGQDAPRRDRYGDALPQGAIARLGTVRLRHGEHVFDMAFSPDGKQLVSCASAVCLWDVKTGKLIRLLAPKRQLQLFGSVAYSADGKQIVASSSDKTVIWNARSGKQIRVNKFARKAMLGVPLSRDGGLRADMANGQLRIWDNRTGKLRTTLKRIPNVYGFSSTKLSPDGKYLAAMDYGKNTIYLWDTSSGKLLKQQAKCEMPFAFSPSSKTLAWVDTRRGTVSIWNWQTERPVRRYRPDTLGGWGESGKLDDMTLAFSPDGKVLTMGGQVKRASHKQGAIHRIEVATGKTLPMPRGHGSHVRHLRYSADGSILASYALDAATIRLWDTRTGKPLHKQTGHLGAILAVAYSPDGKRIASASGRSRIRIWDSASHKQLPSIQTESTLVGCLTYAPSGKWIASGSGVSGDMRDTRISIWDAATGKPQQRLAGHSRPVRTLQYSPNGKWLISTDFRGKEARLWDAATHQMVRIIHPGEGSFSSPVFSPDSRNFVTVAFKKGQYQVWQAATGKLLRQFEWPDRIAPPIGLAFSADLLISVSFSGTIRLVDARSDRTWHEIKRHPRNQSYACTSAVSPDGGLVAVGGEQWISLWEVASGQRVAHVRTRSKCTTMTFAPDGMRLCTASESGALMIWDLRELIGQARYTAKPLEASWSALRNSNQRGACVALLAMTSRGQAAVVFLRKKLTPTTAQTEEIQDWVARLGSRRAVRRTVAFRKLRKLGDRAVPALRAALAADAPLDLRKRIALLLEPLRQPIQQSPNAQQRIRAMQVLVLIGSEPARKLLRSLDTQFSRRALLRLEQRRR